MIVDTSAIMAILLAEPEARRFAEPIAAAPRPRMSAGNHIELTIASMRGARRIAHGTAERLLAELGIGLEPVTAEHVELARAAIVKFGRGQHPAALHFGDCFASALAEASGEPLLFKGDDFARTDLRAAA